MIDYCPFPGYNALSSSKDETTDPEQFDHDADEKARQPDLDPAQGSQEKDIMDTLQIHTHLPVRSIALFQTRYPYGKSQYYLPSSLINLGSRLMRLGITVSLTDLNIDRLDSDVVERRLQEAEVIGFTVVGPPYIQGVIETIHWLRLHGWHQPVVIGGPGSWIKAIDFKGWFGHLTNVHQADTNERTEQILGIAPGRLVSEYQTSATPMLRTLGHDSLKRYLTREISLFTSQGCGFNCGYCAAKKDQPEVYRELAAVEDELRFICTFLRSIGHRHLHLYLSNLDLFQTPASLEAIHQLIDRVSRSYGIRAHTRGLATVSFTAAACRKDPGLATRLRALGLEIVAFGVDGASVKTWHRQGKRHNSFEKIEASIAAMKLARIKVELLMVIGFDDDTEESYPANFSYSLRQAWRGMVIRPYLGKSRTPSGDWPEDNPMVEEFRRNVSLLQRVDYAMIASPETHPDPEIRRKANLVYLGLIAILAPLGRCPTRPLFPVPKRGLGRWFWSLVNRLMPFDR